MPLTPDEAEVRLISSINSSADLALASKRGVSIETFSIYGDVWMFMLEYAKMYNGQIPISDDLENSFRNSDTPIAIIEGGDLEYYVNEILKQHLIRKAQEAIREGFGDKGVRLLKDPFEVVQSVALNLQQLSRQQEKGVAFFDRDAADRLGWLQAKIDAYQRDEPLGIPTGLTVFDSYQQGWQPGETAMIIGPKGVGKSWFMMYEAVVAYAAGFKVLFLSPEMSWEQGALRFDVLLAHRYKQQFSHDVLTSGRDADLVAYAAWLDSLTDREEFICVDNADLMGFTLTNISALIDEYRPDITILDGIHLVKSLETKSDWQIIKDCADGLKAIALAHKSVAIWSGQVDRDGMKNPTEPVSSGAQAAYSKAAVEAADRLITLGTVENNPARRSFKVPNNRSGREWLIRQYLTFNVDVGNIEQVDFLPPMAFGEEEEMDF